MQDRPGKPLRIGVFSANFQGFFIGELANQILAQCRLRGIEFRGYCTAGYGRFDFDFGVQHLDGAIIIRNAIAPDMAKRLLTRGIKVVSIAHDYFPLDIPLICSNNAKGTELAFEHLQSKHHTSMAFIGDLRHYDLRKRYERFVELQEAHGASLSDELLIVVDDTDISGGLQGAKEFVQRNCQASGIFCATGFTSIGFVKGLVQRQVSMEKFDIVSYDAMPLNAVLSPQVCSIDQNIHLIAYQALSCVIRLVRGEKVARTIAVDPKLICNDTDDIRADSPYLATSVDLEEIYNPAYVASLLNNNYVWAEDAAESKLEKLMAIALVFEKHMKSAYFTTIKKGTSNSAKVIKQYTVEGTETFSASADQYNISIDAFPPPLISAEDPNWSAFVCHYFISVKETICAAVSICSDMQSSTPSSFLYLSGILESICTKMSQKLAIKLQERQLGDDAHNKTGDTNNLVTWNMASGETQWTREALDIIGIRSEIDVNIYQNMEIDDRITEKNKEFFRSSLRDALDDSTPLDVTCNYRLKSQAEVTVRIRGKLSKDESGTQIYTFTLNKSDSEC